MDNTPVSKLKCLPKEFDPRSPTIDFDRTPIMINESSSSIGSLVSQEVSFKSVLETSYDSFDISREDPSPVVSSLSLDMENSCNLNTETDREVPDDQIMNSVPESSSTTISTAAAKKIIFSPSMKNSPHKKFSPLAHKNADSFTCFMDEDVERENPQQPIKTRSPRTPLASLTVQTNSPVNILRAKQWKDFQQEREKLGLVKSEENALPAFKTAPASVPAKMPVRRRPLV